MCHHSSSVTEFEKKLSSQQTSLRIGVDEETRMIPLRPKLRAARAPTIMKCYTALYCGCLCLVIDKQRCLRMFSRSSTFTETDVDYCKWLSELFVYKPCCPVTPGLQTQLRIASNTRDAYTTSSNKSSQSCRLRDPSASTHGSKSASSWKLPNCKNTDLQRVQA